MIDILNTKPVVYDITLPVETVEVVEGLPLVMTPKDVAKVLQVSRNTAYELIHCKDFPAFRVGKQFRVNRDKFIEWTKSQSVA